MHLTPLTPYFLFLLLAAGCGRKAVPVADSPPPASAVDDHDSQTSLDWAGIYAGFLPAGDGEGIFTTLTLVEDGDYLLKTDYAGREDTPTVRSGSFRWLPDGNRIQLEGLDTTKQPTIYAVGEGHLRQLDLKGKRIEGDLAERYRLEKSPPGLVERQWTLTLLDGQPPSQAGKQTPHMTFWPAVGRLVGFGGCNEFRTPYTLSGDHRLDLAIVAATKMVCPAGEQEQRFFRMLERTDKYRVAGDTLHMLSYRDEVLLTFVGS